jgi:hypothetical protein
MPQIRYNDQSCHLVDDHLRTGGPDRGHHRGRLEPIHHHCLGLQARISARLAEHGAVATTS